MTVNLIDPCWFKVIIDLVLRYLVNTLTHFSLLCTPRCNVSTTELRRAAIHLLLSMLCLPLHFQDLAIKGYTVYIILHILKKG